jgi:hypothetical protein
MRADKAPRNALTSRVLDIVARDTPPNWGTYRVALLTCRFSDGETRRLFCKFVESSEHTARGHRSGVEYEAFIYEHLLAGISLPTLTSYGLLRDPGDNTAFLALEFLERPLRVTQAGRHAVESAAEWIGFFHSIHDRPASPHQAMLSYSVDYYCSWAKRARAFAGLLGSEYEWFYEVTSKFRVAAQLLLDHSHTVIHGEYYPKNILFHEGRVYPVDWESAAVAPGEIDLAALIEHWPGDVAEDYIDRYVAARWRGAAPASFRSALDAARLYLHLRWLGNDPSWVLGAGAPALFEGAKAAALRLGLL